MTAAQTTAMPIAEAAEPPTLTSTRGCAPGHGNFLLFLRDAAPGVHEWMSVKDDARWRDWLNARPDWAMLQALQLLRLEAADARLRWSAGGGYVEICAQGATGLVAMACLWDITLPGAEVALASLRGGGRA